MVLVEQVWSGFSMPRCDGGWRLSQKKRLQKQAIVKCGSKLQVLASVGQKKTPGLLLLASKCLLDWTTSLEAIGSTVVVGTNMLYGPEIS